MSRQVKASIPTVARVAGWLEAHPRSVFSSTIVLTMLAAMFLSATPEPVLVEVRADDPDAPLFI